jgi:hypothetical protein
MTLGPTWERYSLEASCISYPFAVVPCDAEGAAWEIDAVIDFDAECSVGAKWVNITGIDPSHAVCVSPR